MRRDSDLPAAPEPPPSLARVVGGIVYREPLWAGRILHAAPPPIPLDSLVMATGFDKKSKAAYQTQIAPGNMETSAPVPHTRPVRAGVRKPSPRPTFGESVLRSPRPRPGLRRGFPSTSSLQSARQSPRRPWPPRHLVWVFRLIDSVLLSGTGRGERRFPSQTLSQCYPGSRQASFSDSEVAVVYLRYGWRGRRGRCGLPLLPTDSSLRGSTDHEGAFSSRHARRRGRRARRPRLRSQGERAGDAGRASDCRH
jgi:hypothetical protein